MSTCKNCFSGCTDITSDQCVKYTGVDVPILGIKNGDSLSYVEQALSSFLVSTLDGRGIFPNLDLLGNVLGCSSFSSYLPTCGDISMTDLVTALIQVSCQLHAQVDLLAEQFINLNSEYEVACLVTEEECIPSVETSSGTHSVLQAVIDKICLLDVKLIELDLDLSTNYVATDDFNDLISTYLNSTSSTTMISSKMIPYVAVPYFGALNNFNGDGSGIGNWAKIYLCNGKNSTPDLRGSTLVGRTDMLGGPFASNVDPALPGNPTYAGFISEGNNTIVLAPSQIPSHSHIATSTITDPGHFHYEFNSDEANAGTPLVTSTTYATYRNELNEHLSYRIKGTSTTPSIGKSSSSTTGTTAATTNASTGGGLSHNNIQPVVACYFIIYIP